MRSILILALALPNVSLLTAPRPVVGSHPSPKETGQARGATVTLWPGSYLYDEVCRCLTMMNAYEPPNVPDLGQLWRRRGNRWEMDSATGPAMRNLSRAVYDTRRKRIVMYGGIGKTGYADLRDDTWEWDGRIWKEMEDISVGTRDHHSMAYDEARGRAVMYGGVSSNRSLPRDTWVYPTDTWVWDGAKWAKITGPNPGPRVGFGMVYDAKRKQVVGFGGTGKDPAKLRDTWTWDGHAWTKVSDDGPEGQVTSAMAFDPKRGVVLLFSAVEGGLWQWDGKKWTDIAVTGPKPGPLLGAGLVYDKARGKMVLFGGLVRENGTARPSEEIWEWDGKRWFQAT